MPGLVRSTEDSAGPLYTAAAQTIAAQYTQVSQRRRRRTNPLPTGAVPTFAPPPRSSRSRPSLYHRYP